MNRRMFVAVGASAAAAASSAAAAALTLRPTGKGERVTLAGWIEPAPGARHAFVLRPRAGAGQPGATGLGLASDELMLVYPKDTRAMRSGPARLEGRLYRGAFTDHVTGHSARVVLTEARLV